MPNYNAYAPAVGGQPFGPQDWGSVFQNSLTGLLPAGALALLAPGAENLPPAMANFTLGMMDRQLGEQANLRNIGRTNDAISGIGQGMGNIANMFGNSGYNGNFTFGGRSYGNDNFNAPGRNIDSMFDSASGSLGGYNPGTISGSNVNFNEYRANPNLDADTGSALNFLGQSMLSPGELYGRSGFEQAAASKRAAGLSDIASSTQAMETEGRNAVLGNLGGQTGLQDLGGALSSASMAARQPGVVAGQQLESGLTGAEFGARSQLAGQEANINAGLSGQGAGIISQMGLGRENIRANNIGQLLSARMNQEGLNQSAQMGTEQLRANQQFALANALGQGDESRGNFLFNMLAGQQGNTNNLAGLLSSMGMHQGDLLAGITENIGSLQAPFNQALGSYQQLRAMNTGVGGGGMFD